VAWSAAEASLSFLGAVAEIPSFIKASCCKGEHGRISYQDVSGDSLMEGMKKLGLEEETREIRIDHELGSERGMEMVQVDVSEYEEVLSRFIGGIVVESHLKTLKVLGGP